jgi:FtsP/CotA-like multicopper oxidase with cupredoxin domain
MGGLFWYHPHHHGSETLQLGAGAFGVIIVEDAVDEVPPFIVAMPERIVGIAHMNMRQMQDAQNLFNTAFFQVKAL